MKAKYIYTTLLLFIGTIHVSFAQYTMFGKSGTVSYDKTMYMKNIVKKQYIDKAEAQQKQWFESLVDRVPENAVLKKELKFKNNETLFSSVKQEMDPKLQGAIMQLALDFDAITYSNLLSKDYQRFNDVVGQKMIIQDSVKQINGT